MALKVLYALGKGEGSVFINLSAEGVFWLVAFSVRKDSLNMKLSGN